jgi:hypothetical protein
MTTTRLLVGGLFVAVPVLLVGGFTGLQMTFEYPDILRHPAGEVLTRFAAGGADLRAYWYLMFAASLGLVPAVVGLAVMFWKTSPLAAALGATFGVLAGLVQALGLLRWTVLVPALAQSYTAPGATELDQALAANAFEVANAYLGMGVGEHVGYILTALFTVAATLLIARSWPAMAWAGAAVAIGVAAGALEVFGVPGVGAINAVAYMAWALWAIVLGALILRRGEPAVLPTTGPAAAIGA